MANIFDTLPAETEKPANIFDSIPTGSEKPNIFDSIPAESEPWHALRSDAKQPPVKSAEITSEDADVVRKAAADGKPVVMVNGKPTIGEKPINPELSTGDKVVQGAESALGTTALRIGAGAARLASNPTADMTGIADSLSKDAADWQKQQPDDTASKIGHGIGGAAGLIASGGLPGAMANIGLQSQAEKLSFGAALKSVPELAAYWLLGMGAGKLVGPLVAQSSPVVKGLASGAAATAANIVSSAGIRAANGQAVIPDAESLAQDALFGFGAHGMEVGKQAATDRASVVKMLENAPDDALQMAATDPDFRKSSPYDPKLIDAEIARRAAKETPAAGPASTTAQTASPEELTPATAEASRSASGEATPPLETPQPSSPAAEQTTPAGGQTETAKAAGEIVAREPIGSEGPGAAAASEFGEQSQTGIRNAIVDAQREASGLPPREAPLKRAFGPLWDEALRAFDQNPDVGKELVDSLVRKSRPMTDAEDAILTHEQMDRQNDFDRAIDRVNNAETEAEHAQAQAQLNQARDSLQEIFDVGQKAGTENARGLNARRLMIREDFSLGQMENQMRAAVNGKGAGTWDSLPDAEKQKYLDQVKQAHDRIAELEKKVSEHESAKNDDLARHYFDQLLKETGNDRKAAQKAGKSVTDFISDQAQKARERIRARGTRLTAGLDPVDLVDHAIIGADYIAKGVSKVADWSVQMIREFGDGIKPYLDQLFEKSQQFHDANRNLFEKNAKGTKPETPQEIIAASKDAVKPGEPIPHKLAYDLARAHVKSGVEGFENVMKAVHDSLKTEFPSITQRQVNDAFSEYGKVKFPSKEADKMKLSEYRRIGQLVSAIEDASRGEAPKKSGMQRSKPTQTIREKMAQLRDVMDKAGIETRSPEEQLASRNQARATALRNSIEDLDKRLRTGEKPVAGKPVPDSAEVESLRAERDAMKAKLKEIEDAAKPKPTPEGIAQDEAQKAVDRAAAALDRQQRINSGEIQPEGKEKAQPLTDLEKDLRDKTEELRKAKREADAATRKPTPEEEQSEKAQKGVDAAAAALDKWDRILKGEIQSESKTPREPGSNLEEEMRAQVEAMKAAHRELKANERPKTDPESAREQAVLKALEKSIAEYERRAREVDLEPKGKRQGPDTEQVAKAKAARDAAKQVVNDMREAQKIVNTPEQRRLEAYKKSLTRQTQEIQSRMARGDYAPKPKTSTPLDSDALKLLIDRDRARQQFQSNVEKIRAQNRTVSQKFWDRFVGIQRAMKLSSDVVLAKLTIAAAAREGVLTPAEEVVGGAVSKVLPGLAERAPREGRLSLQAEMKAKAAVFTKGMRDAWENLKMNKSDLEVQHGSNAPKAPPEWYEYFGFLHGALKAPVKRAEFERSLAKRMEHATRSGIDVDDPNVMKRLSQESYVDANRAIFMQDNVVSKGFNAAVGAMEKSKTAPNLGPAMARVARFLVPIVKVPTNIVGEVATGIHGTVTGSLRAANAYMKGIENLPPEHADAIMRQLKKGLVGNALLLTGYLGYKSIGGFYHKDDQRKKGDVAPLHYRIGGVDLPSWAGHSTAGMLLDIGASLHRVEDEKVKGGGKKGIGSGVVAAGSGLVKDLPFVPAASNASGALESEDGFHKYIHDMITSTAIPGGVMHAAKIHDTPGSFPSNALRETNRRFPQTNLDALKVGIPGLREQVPMKKPHR